MPTVARRLLGVLLCVGALLGAWVVVDRGASARRAAAEQQARAEALTLAQQARRALDAEGEALVARAVSGAELLRSIVAASTLGEAEVFDATLKDAFETEPWWHPYTLLGKTTFFLAGRRAYSAPELPMLPPAIEAVVAEATTAGRAVALTLFEGRPLWLVGARAPEPNRQQAWGVLVLLVPVSSEQLAAAAKATGAALALLPRGGEQLRGGGSEPALEAFLAGSDEASACCARLTVVEGLTLVAGRSPEARLAAAEAEAGSGALTAWLLGGVVALLGVALAAWPASKVAEEHAALLRETTAQLQQSQEQLQRFSQSIAPATAAAHAAGASPATPAEDDGLGSTQASAVQSRYEVLAPLGEGGMARVSVAMVRGAEGFRRLFVLKRLRAEVSENQEIVNQFIDEARLGASLVHSNIIPVFDFGRDAQGYYLAQEYILGRDVAALLAACVARRQAALPPRVVSWLAAEALKALSYAHTKADDAGRPLGLVHRDVSPNNLMVTARGELKLLDFGIVKSDQRLTKTQPGMVKGNLFYMSPEQAQGLPVDPRADLFSLGLVLYFAAAGRHLYDGQSQYELITRAAAGLTDVDRRHVGELPAPLRGFLLRLLATDPAQRFPSAEAAAAAVPGPLATAAEVQALMEELLGNELAAERARFAEAGGAA